MLGILIAAVALQCIVLLLLVSRIAPLCRFAGACVAVFKTRNGYRVSKLLVFLLAIMFAATLYKMRRIQSTADLHYRHIFAALLGSSLFLAGVLHQIHTIVFQDEPLKKTVGVLKLQLQTSETEKAQLKKKQKEYEHLDRMVSDLRVQMEKMQIDSANKNNEINELRMKLENMKIDVESKAKELRVAEASVQALKKQGEGLLLEYDRLIEDNGNLRKQLAYFDKKYSGSDIKKKS